MRALILAADTGLSDKDNDVPKCLLRLKDHTILEHQVRKLNELGIKDIITVVGGEGECWKEDAHERVRDISPMMVVNPKNRTTRSGYSFLLGLERLGPGPVIVIDGDLVFSGDMMRELINSAHENVLISRLALSISEKGGRIVTSKERVIKAGRSVGLEDFPWNIYAGIAKVGQNAIKDLTNHIADNPETDLLDAIGAISGKDVFHVLSTHRKATDKKSVIGGSYANVQVRKIIRKEAKGIGRQKLIDEITWLKNLPEDIKPFFPEIKDYGITDEVVYLEQPFYEWPSFRDMLFNSAMDSTRALAVLDKVLGFLFGNVYNKDVQRTPENFLEDFHFHRFWYRLDKTRRQSPVFEGIIDAKKIRFNDEVLLNAPALINYLENDAGIRQQLTCDHLSRYVHADLHFENILIDPESDGFMLVDPRGYDLCDHYYDLGKLYHCVNGLYDFIHENRFELEWKAEGDTINARLEIPESAVVREYRKIRSGMPELFLKHSGDGDCMKKIRFSEAMHFCTLMPFHLKFDGREDTAISFYLTGTKLMNDFMKDHLEDFTDVNWINVNTPSEYEKARNWSRTGE